jgi:hypothetical protein
MTTGKKDACKAGKLLSNPKTPRQVKSVAASDLALAAAGKHSARHCAACSAPCRCGYNFAAARQSFTWRTMKRTSHPGNLAMSRRSK